MERLISRATGSFAGAFRFAVALTFAAAVAAITLLTRLDMVDAAAMARTAPFIGAGITACARLWE